jgi:uncharacterized damage-inducible protein DinB
VDPYLQPAAHALVQAREDLARVGSGLTTAQLWLQPNAAASVGYHLRHLAGSLDRLLTYARGQQLNERQLAALKSESDPNAPRHDLPVLVNEALRAIDAAIEQIRSTRREELLESREVGRARLPSTVLGLLTHAAEHTTRHIGQAITTAKIVSAQRA